jgi:hypothetical protein
MRRLQDPDTSILHPPPTRLLVGIYMCGILRYWPLCVNFIIAESIIGTAYGRIIDIRFLFSTTIYLNSMEAMSVTGHLQQSSQAKPSTPHSLF